ncbi:MAG: HAD-IIB family hydrolase [Vicinamibacterales bacterium]
MTPPGAPRRIRLIATDIDGTLLDSAGQVPPANLEALAAAARAGVHLAVATGRSFSFAQPPVAGVADPLTLIVHNGAIARMRTGETLVRRLLPRTLARDILTATASWRPSTVVLFDRPGAGHLVYDRMDWSHPNRAGFRERNRHLIAEVAALEDALDEDPIQVAFNGGVEEMRRLQAELAALPAAGDLAISVAEYPHRDFCLVDVCSAGTTKGSALASVADALGLARDEVMAIGDNHNDREMLEWAGVGVVMGNAEPGLFHDGFHRTASNDEAGLALAIRRFILGN